ncbi:hypothetical protein BJ875DRAFT_74888 [Amylocarpus encephaloides]|uniref:Fe2OG dioxygenase domain-containing protein n=1 Tax=Amylocarpus encephaloides TaxID=45428 RepID=A0A9P7YGB4_9HELO|nr:hypothetical protein BJ875DRAFT_74888 [Amylocarpus encephaloides]
MFNLGYLAALLPLYIFVWLPIQEMLFGPSQRAPDTRIPSLNRSFIASDDPLDCPPHHYNTFILSHEPLIVYIEDFLSADESKHLIEISEDKFTPSTVSTGAEASIQTDIRHSEVALIARDDQVRCIENRARAFQGWRPDLHIERLRTQRYGVGGHYRNHFDWSGASRDADRVSTFMVYVDADCEGGGTKFPRLRMPDVSKGRWCEFLECDRQQDEDRSELAADNWGITFKPIKGNAIFWENLRPDGRGYEETFHAGLPVLAGTKIGLNIWSWGPARRI